LRALPSAHALIAALVLGAAGCSDQPETGRVPTPAPVARATLAAPKVTRIEAGPDAPKQAQTAMIKAKPGEVIEFAAGKFEFPATLSLDVSDVTIRGQGTEKTILSFKNQGQGTGGEGLLLTAKSGTTLQDLAIEDAKGDAVKVQGTRGLRIKNVRAEWTGGPKETNGGYGLYPVLCEGVLIEECTVRGASDAGIYVGQSYDVVVRRNTALQNVAGIEIENCTRADVYENVATDNAGGILVFTMPDLPKKDGRHCRVFKNKVVANNHENFAPRGNIVATVPPGTGVMIMASDECEVFDNAIEKNQTAGLSIVSYLIADKPTKDDKFDPFCEAIWVHDNRFASNGEKPAGPLGLMVAQAVGTPLPDILYDGMADPRKVVDGALPEALAIRIRDNGDADFANFDAAGLKEAVASTGNPNAKKPTVSRDLKPYDGKIKGLEPVSLESAK
jgi:parallel beta-helix repeat protein